MTSLTLRRLGDKLSIESDAPGFATVRRRDCYYGTTPEQAVTFNGPPIDCPDSADIVVFVRGQQPVITESQRAAKEQARAVLDEKLKRDSPQWMKQFVGAWSAGED